MSIKKCAVGFVSLLVLLLNLGMITTKAATPYETYTYSYQGNMQISPNAYIPQKKLTQFGNGQVLKSPSDMVVDKKNRIVIADKDNNRIVILNSKFDIISIIDKFQNKLGKSDSFNKPQGVYVAPNGDLLVADTDNSRIVIFDEAYNYLTTIDPPNADILPKNFKYNPKSIAQDRSGRIYVVSKNTNMGVIVMNKNGEFEGFIGAQRVKVNLTDALWKMFMTEDQINRSTSFVPIEYSNLTMDEKGFIYITASSIDRYTLYNTIWSRSTDSTYAPVKKINPSGTDVLHRNGFFPPAGDINFDPYSNIKEPVNPSSITELCLLNNGMYSLIDSEYNKVFTYDSYGNLLYAFGGTGEAIGLFKQLKAVAYLGDNMLALDAQDGSITLLSKTAYGVKLDEVIKYQENREFDKVYKGWTEIIGLNNNFDMAYLGIGKTLLEQGKYKAAMDNFRLINNQSYYSKAYKLYRQQILEKIGIFLLAIFLILMVLIIKFFGLAKKYNMRSHKSGSKRTIRSELIYGFYLIFHPFYGFWDLKHERRGSARSATIILVTCVFSFLYKDLGSSYLLKSAGQSVSLVSSVLNLLLPFVLWCIANWCLTSLMDGKGNFKDIYISTCFALIPLIIFNIPITIISNFLVQDELAILSFATNIGVFWTAFLIFFGSLTTHEYSMKKNVLVCILTIAGIGLVLFLLMIFFSITGQMVDTINNIINEVTFRM